jgi:hypothetical protein
MRKHDPLAANRARVVTAERELETARDAMRSRAKILGIARTALFGDCAFVSRESAKEWVKDARAEVHAEARASRRENIAALERIADDRAAGKPSAFAHLNTSDFREWAQFETDPSKCSAAYLQRRKAIDTAINTATALSKLCKAQGLKFEDVFGPGSLATPASLAMAERLIGGANRSGAVADAPDDVAAAVIESGRRRRGESDATSPLLRVVADNDEPAVMTAEGILLAGKRRRGEI